MYTGPSKNKNGSLAFAYSEQEADLDLQFIYFVDGMNEEKVSLKAYTSENIPK